MIVPVRVRPGASRTRVGGRYEGRYGAALLIAVTAPPVAGRATEAAVRAFAEALGLRRAAVSIRAVDGSRDKLFAIVDPPDDLDTRLTTLRNGATRREPS